jgi:predicted acetyltransferase
MVGFLRHEQHFGKVKLKVGEITYVGTHPEHRKKGLSSEIINYWFEEAKKKNMPICFLFGIANFYQQFDFEYAIPTHKYKYVIVDKNMLEPIKGNGTVEKYEEKYAEAIVKIYEEASKENFCSKVRSLEYFKYRIKKTTKGNHHWYVVKKNNQVCGYIWYTLTDKEMLIREAQIIDDEAGKSLAEFIFSLIKGKTIQEVGLQTPLNNSFAKFLYKKGARNACTNEIFPHNWAGMYKILLLEPAIEALIPSFEERLYSSRFYAFTGNINIATSLGGISILINKGKVKVEKKTPSEQDIKIPIKILTSIYTGYKDICYYKEEIDFKGEENYELLKILFPLGNPYVWDLEMSGDEI